VAALVSLVVVLAVSLVIMRAGATALTLTGISREAARFQAQSAFLGVGFTTRESELVLAHPVRRRIVMVLMLLGNAGVVAGISTVVLVFLSSPSSSSSFERGIALLVAVAAFVVAATSRVVDVRLSRAVEWALRRWTHLDVRDYASLLRLAGEYAVVELAVRPGAWLAERTLEQLDLRSEGVLVLGIERKDGGYVGVPRGPTRILSDDTLIVYGRAAQIHAVDERRAGPEGDREHAEAVARHRERLGIPPRPAPV
jgi:hypothetical protein